MTWARSATAVLAGIGVIAVVIRALELTLMNSLAPAPITSAADYFALQNQPMVLAAKLGYTAGAALLGGYIAAKVALGREIAHGVAVAVIETAMLTWGFTQGELASYIPAWMRAALMMVTASSVVAGAAIRARAARLSAGDPTRTS